MKVGYNNQTTQIQGLDKSKEASESKKAEKNSQSENTSTAASSRDQFGSVKMDISARGKEFAEAKKVAEQTPDIREERIQELKRRIANNEYNVKSGDIAEKMVDEHLSGINVD